MALSAGNFLLVGSVLLFVSILAGKTGYRFGVPALLLFLIVGMVFGSEGFGIQFSNFKATQFIGMVALSIILFSGGMDTREDDIKPIAKEGIVLSTVGVILTALFTGLFAYAFPTLKGALGLMGCLLLASIMSSTDSASVFSILRAKNLHIQGNVRALLELESGSNDPMAYMLTIMLISFVKYSNLSFDIMLWTVIIQFFVGGVFGYIFGRLAVLIMNKINLDYSSLYSVLLLAICLFIFSVTDFAHGNGYLAVYLAGLVVGNNKVAYKKSVTVFFDGIAWLCQIVMFLALGLLVNPSELIIIAPLAIGVALFMTFVARPLTVFLCLLPFKKITRQGKYFISWVGLRGAVPIIFATYPYVEGVPFAKTIFNIVFFITIISLVLQGTTVPLFAKIFGVLDENVKHKDFAVYVPEDIAITSEIKVTPALLKHGNTIRSLGLEDNALPIMIKRAGKYIIARGATELQEGDKLLLIAKKEDDLNTLCSNLDIQNCEVYRDE